MRIFVTGAAGGLGAAIVKRAVECGHSIVAADLDQSRLATALQDATTNCDDIRCVTLDVTDARSWATTIDATEQSAPIDVLINCAGVLVPGAVGDLCVDDIKRQLDVNVLGLILGADCVARKMKDRKAGHIINVGSTASLFPTPGNTIYTATKYAVRAFTIAAAGDLRPHGIDVSMVGPTAIKTNMLEVQRGDENAALTFSGPRALDAEEVATIIIDKVLRTKALETYIPAEDEMQGKLASTYPENFLSNVDKIRKHGINNFTSEKY